MPEATQKSETKMKSWRKMKIQNCWAKYLVVEINLRIIIFFYLCTYDCSPLSFSIHLSPLLFLSFSWLWNSKDDIDHGISMSKLDRAGEPNNQFQFHTNLVFHLSSNDFNALLKFQIWFIRNFSAYTQCSMIFLWRKWLKH